MSATALPAWRRTPARRAACTLLAMLPALGLQAAWLDDTLPARAGWLAGGALLTTAVLRTLHSADNGSGRSPTGSHFLETLATALLLAALWPATAALWPAVAALVGALILAAALGGVAVNPFPPPALALTIGVVIAQVSGIDLHAGRLLVHDTLIVAGVWLASALVLAGLGLLHLAPMLIFALPVAFACLIGELPVMSFMAAALASGFFLGEPRHLPSTPSGRIVVAGLAGLATGILWLHGAPPVTIGCTVLLACALTPWVEALTLPPPPGQEMAQ